MDAPGEPGPGATVDPSAAFFGLWPRFADTHDAVPGLTPFQRRAAPVAEEVPARAHRLTA